MSEADGLRPEDLGIGKLFWHVVDAVVVADVGTGRIVLWSPSAERIFGYRERDAVGRRIEEVLIPERLRGAHQAGLARYRDTGQGRLMEDGAPVEVPALCADGDEIPVELTLSPIESARDGRRYVLALVRDARARKEAEEQRAQLSAAQRAAEAREQVIGAIAHDLRTPVTSILGSAQLAKRGLERGQVDVVRLATTLDRIERSATRMRTMLGELVDAVRLGAGEPLELDRKEVDLVSLAGEAVAELAAEMPERPFRVEAAADAVGEWDPERLRRVLDNLIGNAVKYSPDEAEVLVRVGPDPHDPAEVVLVVEDRGIGIPADDLPRVFEPFHRGANVAGRVPGTGIGLAGARLIVAQHGGAIAVASQEGVGTTVTIRLPRHPPVG